MKSWKPVNTGGCKKESKDSETNNVIARTDLYKKSNINTAAMHVKTLRRVDTANSSTFSFSTHFVDQEDSVTALRFFF